MQALHYIENQTKLSRCPNLHLKKSRDACTFAKVDQCHYYKFITLLIREKQTKCFLDQNQQFHLAKSFCGWILLMQFGSQLCTCMCANRKRHYFVRPDHLFISVKLSLVSDNYRGHTRSVGFMGARSHSPRASTSKEETTVQTSAFLIRYFECHQRRSFVLKIVPKSLAEAPDSAEGAHHAPSDPLLDWGVRPHPLALDLGTVRVLRNAIRPGPPQP